MNAVDELEKIFKKYKIEKNINEIISEDENLFNYKNINVIPKIKHVYKEIKKIYNESLQNICENVNFINWIVQENSKDRCDGNCFETQNIWNDLFIEIESIIAYTKMFFLPKPCLYTQIQTKYHAIKSLFLYLFSSFDRIACLLYYHFNIDRFNSDENFEKTFNKNIKNLQFNNLDNYIYNESLGWEKIKSEFKKIKNSFCFEYIRNSRNVFYHRFSNPLLRYHFHIDVMITFVLLVNVVLIIKKYL